MLRPDFKPGQNLADKLTASKLNELVRAVNANKPLASDSVSVSYTGIGAVITSRNVTGVVHPFKILVAQPDESWELSVYPGVVHNTSYNNKRRFSFKVVEASAEMGTQTVSPGDSVWELYIKMTFEAEDIGPLQAFEEHMVGVAGPHCVRALTEVEFYWHSVTDTDADEGTTKPDQKDVRYYYIGRVTFTADGYTVDQRRKSDIDICDPCEDPGSSDSSGTGSGDSDAGTYVVTDIACAMEPVGDGECCVTLTLTKKKLLANAFILPYKEKTVEVNCCGD